MLSTYQNQLVDGGRRDTMSRGRWLARKRMRLASTGGLAGPPTSFGSNPTTPQDLCPKLRATTARAPQGIPAVAIARATLLVW